MASYTLDIDEFAALVGFLEAKKIVGMDEAIFASFSETNLPNIMAKLEAHGWMERADRPDSWHTNEDLFATLAIAAAPDFAILGRSRAQPKSVLFYVADDEFVQIVVTDETVVVTNIADEQVLAASLVTFLDKAFPAEIVVARVEGEVFDAGRIAKVEEDGSMNTSLRGSQNEAASPWNEATVAAFVQGAVDELRAE